MLLDTLRKIFQKRFRGYQEKYQQVKKGFQMHFSGDSGVIQAPFKWFQQRFKERLRAFLRAILGAL